MEAKPPTYRIFDRSSHGHKSPVVQLRSIKGERELKASELEAYIVIEPIATPFYRVRIVKGSIMLLATDAAADLIATGRIRLLLETPQIPWRVGYDAARAAKYAERNKSKSLG